MSFREEYETLVHAIQTGVKYKMEIEGPGAETSPKHLRTGLNAAMVEHGALVKLLVDKGLIAQEKYERELLEFMRREKEDYERWLSAHHGANITLG